MVDLHGPAVSSRSLSMNKDIGPILEGWGFRPDEVTVRKVPGIDGREKIQLRLELGLYQMEMTGRPDGTRPHGHESLLDHYLSVLVEHRTKYGSEERFKLNSEDCTRLRMESLQYYHRRISLFELKDYRAAERDADHNLQIMDLLKQHAENEADRMLSEQYRAFVLMDRTKARVHQNLARRDYRVALSQIDEGIELIEDFFKEHGRADLIEKAMEVGFLRNWRSEISQQIPVSEPERLELLLKEAVDQENFERAAELRDRLRDIRGLPGA